jgi:mono/diheme cytochrome c family protein
MLFVFMGGVAMTAAAEPVDSKAGNVSHGSVTWSQNCARCHEMRSPTEFRDDLWKPIVTHMRIRAGLTGQQQRDVLAFLQASNHPFATQPPITGDNAPGTGLSGKQIYDQTCVACHGADGTGGMPGVPDFTNPAGALSKSDDVLMQNILGGFQSPGSPMAMPAKGGNPDLNAADASAVLDYLRGSFGK